MTPAPSEGRPHPLPAGVVEGEAKRRYTPPRRACEKCGRGVLEDWTGRHCERCTFAAHDREWDEAEAVAAMRGVRVVGHPEGAVRELGEAAANLVLNACRLTGPSDAYEIPFEDYDALRAALSRFHVEEGAHG